MQSTHPNPAAVEALVAAGRDAAGRGLVRCSSGNLSCRLGPDTFLVTASRTWMERLTPDDVTLCSLADGSVVSGRKPSVEVAFHAGILRRRPEMDVVLHFQSPYATVAACREFEARQYYVTPEIPYYTGPLAVVPYLPPGSAELAAAVVSALGESNLAVMRNHGQVVVGRDYQDAIQQASFFELACQVLIHAGSAIRPLDDSAVASLLQAGGHAR